MLIEIIFLVVVAIVVIYFLKKQKKQDDKYFGNKTTPNRKEQKQLDYYQSIYAPIPKNERLPYIERDGFELEDIAKNATEIVFEKPIPTKEEISQIKKGNLVKLAFVDNDDNLERMWVKVLKIDNSFYSGLLDNEPHYIENLELGKEIYFHKNNIYDIDFE